MSPEGTTSPANESYLTARQTAERLGVSVDVVRRLCKKGEFAGALKNDVGSWQVPIDAVNGWASTEGSHPQHQISKQPASAPRTSVRSSGHSIVRRLWQGILVVGASIAVLAIVSVVADFGQAKQQIIQWSKDLGIARDVLPARENETLIVIATFYRTEGVTDHDIHGEIRRGIKAAGEALGMSGLRVEVEPHVLRSEDQVGAEALGRRHKASIVIWGEDTGARLTSNFLNLQHPAFPGAKVPINELDGVELADRAKYQDFITRDLPGDFTFLSMFAIGQAFGIRGNLAVSVQAIEQGIAALPEALPKEDDLRESIATAYYHLAWIYALLPSIEDQERAIKNYGKAIAARPAYFQAYLARARVLRDLHDSNGAKSNFAAITRLEAKSAEDHFYKAQAYRALEMWDQAFGEDTEAIRLWPNYAEAYVNRSVTRTRQGDLQGAVDDCTRAIDLNKKYALAYLNRSIAKKHLGDRQGALEDMANAYNLDADLVNASVMKSLSGVP
jgi:tetratricopeptide (TPR) repeat protein